MHNLERAELAVPLRTQDHVAGSRDAPVVIIEYADFECASCAQSANGLHILRKHYEPHVCVALRHYPLPEIHPHAMLAAQAAEGAAALAMSCRHPCYS